MSSGRPDDDCDLRDQYDFSLGKRGKYAERFAEGSKAVIHEAEIAKQPVEAASAMRRSECETVGFAIHERVFSPAECDRLLAALAASTDGRSRAGARHLLRNYAVAALAHDERLLGLARRALGGSAVPFRATLFAKTGRANWLVVWHQDTALPFAARFDAQGFGPWSRKDGIDYAHAPAWALQRVVALRVHLDASAANNGPLRVLPGSHAVGVLTDEEVFARAAARQPADCVVGRGGVLAMRPLLIHASSKARTGAPRRVLHVEYADALTLAPGVRLAVC